MSVSPAEKRKFRNFLAGRAINLPIINSIDLFIAARRFYFHSVFVRYRNFVGDIPRAIFVSRQVVLNGADLGDIESGMSAAGGQKNAMAIAQAIIFLGNIKDFKTAFRLSAPPADKLGTVRFIRLALMVNTIFLADQSNNQRALTKKSFSGKMNIMFWRLRKNFKKK